MTFYGQVSPSWREDIHRWQHCLNQPSFLSPVNHPDAMSSEEGRAERIARYKETRRRQLAEQFNRNGGEEAPSPRRQSNSSTDSSGGHASAVKTTRTYRLRAAANALNGSRTPPQNGGFSRKDSCQGDDLKPASDHVTKRQNTSSTTERDKSSKRKSNLNRSLNSEEVPDEDAKNRRRRRRFFPQDIVEQVRDHPPGGVSTSPAPSPIPRTSTPRKSDLSLHMENARRSLIRTSPKNPEKIERRSSMTSSSLRLVKKMDELTALTKETLARVDALSKHRPSSILKKKSSEEDNTPVSILKKEVTSSGSTPPPVTFSPSVVEPTSRKSGILKKRRSLDESQVLRHRSCSPETNRSILKQQQLRRSSFEDLAAGHAQHGILKRHSDDLDQSQHSSPHSILKRRSGSSSAGSGGGSSQHVSIATAVVLAAAGGAELVPPPHDDVVKPILKKTRSGEETPDGHYHSTEVAPRPILKKKSSTDTDQEEYERPKPILKATNQKPRLSFSESGGGEEEGRRTRRSHTIGGSEWHKMGEERLHNKDQSEELGEEQKKKRPLSVSELVMSFETTGAVPKKNNNSKRGKERCKTQPITYDELEASLNLVKSPQFDRNSASLGSPVPYLLTTTSLDNDSRLNSNLTSFVDVITSSPTSSGVGQMAAADSAFQSLGDGLELEELAVRPMQEQKKVVEMQMKALAQEAQKMALGRGGLGAQKYRNRKSGHPGDKSATSLLGGRFATQPVTLDEVQEASRLAKTEDNDSDEAEADPSKLSLSERIMLFNAKVHEDRREVTTAVRRRQTRFQTQPVTSGEVECARGISPQFAGLDDSCQRPRSILKQSRDTKYNRHVSDDHDRSSTTPTVKVHDCDVTQDEGISCNDSASDSEAAEQQRTIPDRKRASAKFGGRQISSARSGSDTEGESSGAREVRSIFKNENKLRVKQALESVLSKSKSQTAFAADGGDEVINKVVGCPIRKSQTQSAVMMPKTIAEIQARLHQSGESDWRKRVPQNNNATDELKSLKDKNRYNEEKSVLASKKDELDASAQQWRLRVDKNDAEKFSVAGRMEREGKQTIPAPCISLAVNGGGEKLVKTPQAKRFKGKDGSETSSTPTSPDKTRARPELTRSHSVPDPAASTTPRKTIEGRTVSITRPDDDTFTSFFKHLDDFTVGRTCGTGDVKKPKTTDLDLDAVERHSLLVQKKNVQMRSRRRRHAAANPIKALAQRDDIRTEYVEVLTGVAEREQKRINVEKLARNSHFALESLAGLASREKFTEVQLKKGSSGASGEGQVPFKPVMLVQVKGRRHVQTRLVSPSVDSLNEGDVFVLITKNTLYVYTGRYANVIETSRAADVVKHVQRTGDLGCKDVKVTWLERACDSLPEHFWKVLRSEPMSEFVDAGAPQEDELYENNILATNMIYELEGEELVPSEYWGQMPKCDMLGPKKVFVFDFGTEMYVWSGKYAPLEKKKLALKLAKQLWDEGYDYTECDVSPMDVAQVLGDRKAKDVKQKMSADKRPDWALFAKLTQHRETILFKEKFLDWPDFSRVIRVKNESESDKNVDPSFNILPCEIPDVADGDNVDLVVEGCHLGRGDKYYDSQSGRLFEFETLSVTVWRILENQTEKLSATSVGHFYSTDSYTVRWNYRMTVKGRELSGKPSKHAQVGREKVVYFCWQGALSSTNEKGLAALLTVELDSEHAPQIRVVQNYEPAAFLRLFKGKMCVHSSRHSGSRLYMLRGDLDEEQSLVEVPLAVDSLRGRTSFVAVGNGRVWAWHGCQSTADLRKWAERRAEQLVADEPKEMELDDCDDVMVVEEGEEGEEWLEMVGGANPNKLEEKAIWDYRLRAFHLSSISGKFEATEVTSPNRKSDVCSPYPVLQTDLYSASQPALFLIDDDSALWLWQGWWPERDADESDSDSPLTDQTGSGAIRWQHERRAAMQTALAYAQTKSVQPDSTHLVWAGLEPPAFKMLFPYWTERSDVTELIKRDGREADAIYRLEDELSALSRTSYTLDELMQRPLPEGVDPTHLEVYLEEGEFKELLGVAKDEFSTLPMWKQTALKKEKGLF